jgi:hypothetical protein
MRIAAARQNASAGPNLHLEVGDVGKTRFFGRRR